MRRHMNQSHIGYRLVAIAGRTRQRIAQASIKGEGGQYVRNEGECQGPARLWHIGG
jgi:hypothetical protein